MHDEYDGRKAKGRVVGAAWRTLANLPLLATHSIEPGEMMHDEHDGRKAEGRVVGARLAPACQPVDHCFSFVASGASCGRRAALPA